MLASALVMTALVIDDPQECGLEAGKGVAATEAKKSLRSPRGNASGRPELQDAGERRRGKGEEGKAKRDSSTA
jgi:hypothetical protein